MGKHDRTWLVGLTLAAVLSCPPASTASAGLESGDALVAAQQTADQRALQAFLDEIARYMALHRRLHEELPGLEPASSATTIAQTSDALALGIQRARPRARQGDFFRAVPARVIRRRIAATVRDEQLHAALARIDDEPPTIRRPRVYMRFPASAQMATMPPALLRVLPPLPPELEYRIVGRYLVLRDTHAAIVLDFIAGAVPRRAREQ